MNEPRVKTSRKVLRALPLAIIESSSRLSVLGAERVGRIAQEGRGLGGRGESRTRRDDFCRRTRGSLGHVVRASRPTLRLLRSHRLAVETLQGQLDGLLRARHRGVLGGDVAERRERSLRASSRRPPRSPRSPAADSIEGVELAVLVLENVGVRESTEDVGTSRKDRDLVPFGVAESELGVRDGPPSRRLLLLGSAGEGRAAVMAA